MLLFKNVSSNTLQNISFKIGSGELVLFFSRDEYSLNLLYKMIIGQLKPDDGLIKIESDLKKNSKIMGLCGERNDILLPERTIFENLKFVLYFRKQWTEDFSTKIRDTLKIMDIDYLAEKKVSQLMFHQQLRFKLARLLIFEPAVLLFSWPEKQLDEVNGRSLINIFQEFQKKEITVLIFSAQKWLASYNFDCKKIFLKKEKMLSEKK